MTTNGLPRVCQTPPEELPGFYDTWAAGYDAEMTAQSDVISRGAKVVAMEDGAHSPAVGSRSRVSVLEMP